MNTRPIILTQTVQVTVGDGPSMGGYLARPAGSGPFPGVLVGIELFGISGHVLDVCDPTTDIPLSQPEPTLAATSGITRRILFLVGENDQLIPPEQRRAIADALRAADVRHEIVEYPETGHGFLSERRDIYQPIAAEDAWQRIDQLLSAELT